MQETKLLAGHEIGLSIFVSIEEDAPLGICVFHDYGGSHVSFEEFMKESTIDLSKSMRQRYACAFEIMAKQLREEA